MKTVRLKRWISGKSFVRRAVATAVGLALVASALHQVSNEYLFLATLANYNTLSPWASLVAALVIPYLELALACSLLLARMERTGLLMASVLFGVFAAAQTGAYVRGFSISCGCFPGREKELIGPASIAVPCVLSMVSLGMFLTSGNGDHASDGARSKMETRARASFGSSLD